jgi:hypothetical protein
VQRKLLVKFGIAATKFTAPQGIVEKSQSVTLRSDGQ